MGGSAEQGGLRDGAPADVRLIETMLWTPGEGVALILHHLARLEAGCRKLGIDCDLWRVERLIETVSAAEPLRLRLTVGLDGRPDLVTAPLPKAKALWRVGLAEGRVASDDPWRQVKSTERHFYDRVRADLPAAWDEAVFLNERNEVVEGTITNVFLWRDNLLWTPPLRCGALPGVLRAKLLATGRAREAVLRWSDLAEGRFFLGNALRGLVPAEVI